MNVRPPMILAAVFLSACGARPRQTAEPSTRQVEMEEMVVEADASGNAVAYDAQQLFEEGTAAFTKHEFTECDRAYEKLLHRFPKSRYVHSALYNRGLCLEQLGLHRTAATSFRRHAQISRELRDRRDGEFRWGYNMVKAGDYPTAMHLYDELLAADDLGPADRAECRLRRGTILARMKKPAEAERELKRAMELVTQAYDGVVRGNDLFAESHFRRGEIYQGLSHQVRLKLPVRNMRDDLRDKIRFFRQSQSSYIDALNVQHSYWATAAGLKLGELYEEFYRDVLAAEVPDDFDADTKHFYFVELKKQLQPLLEQSVTIYEKNMQMSQRIGAENEWVLETERRLQRLRSLIEETEALKSNEPKG